MHQPNIPAFLRLFDFSISNLLLLVKAKSQADNVFSVLETNEEAETYLWSGYRKSLNIGRTIQLQ